MKKCLEGKKIHFSTSSKEAPPPKIFHPTLNLSIEQPIEDVSYLGSPMSNTTVRRPCF